MKREILKTVTYPIRSELIPDSFHGFRIAVMADLHNCIPGGKFSILVERMRDAKPDLILLAGDMITEEKFGDDVAYDHAMDLLEQMSAIAPVYYGLGNHEQRWKEKDVARTYSYEDFMIRMEEMGIQVLDNQSVNLTHTDGSVRITGLALPNAFFNKKKIVRLSADQIRELVGEAAQEHFQILLAHTPQFFHAYMDWGADLALAGHYHGGVIRLPFLGGVISTNFRLFPKYDYGRYRRGLGEMIVTSGLGCHTIPVRLNNPPEFIVLELRGE